MQLTVKEIFEMIENKKLHYDQTTQRNFLYQDFKTQTEDGEMSKAGAIIRAILKLNIQLPALYFWKNNDGSYNIHDGKQRILSLYYSLFPEKNPTEEIITTNFGYGQISCPDTLSSNEIEKILNYKFDIVVKEGNKELEETSFYEINQNALNLTSYECLKGMYYGNFLTTFEKHLIELKTKQGGVIKDIGRGEQARLFLILCLDDLNSKSKNIDKVLSDKLKKCREEEFKQENYNFDDIIEIYNTLNNFIPKAKDNILLSVSKYIVEKYKNYSSQWDFTKILDYYQETTKKENDINKWDYETHISAINSLIINNLKLDGRRFFNKEEKSNLFKKSPHCSIQGCTVASFDKLEVDHIIPWSKGGRTNETNGQLMCKHHNSSKGNKNI